MPEDISELGKQFIDRCGERVIKILEPEPVKQKPYAPLKIGKLNKPFIKRSGGAASFFVPDESFLLPPSYSG